MRKPTRTGAVGRLLLALALSGAVAGCAKTKAATVADGPPLAMTPPPPRVLAPVEPPLAATPAVAEVPAAPAPRTPPPPPVRRPTVSQPTEVENRPAEPAPPATPAATSSDTPPKEPTPATTPAATPAETAGPRSADALATPTPGAKPE